MTPHLDRAAVLADYDEQVRRSLTPPMAGWQVHRAGGVLRTTPARDGAGFAGWVHAVDLDEDTADAAVAQEVAYFGALDDGAGRPFEWKLYGHDRPTDLGRRLTAAGLVPEEEEAFVVGAVEDVVAATSGAGLPDGVRHREVGAASLDEDVERIAEQQHEIWGRDVGRVADRLRSEYLADPGALRIHLVETRDGARTVCAGWLRLTPGCDFAGLWGGGTSPDWRGRGLYRHLVGVRARQAALAGRPWLQVDASADSRPILTRLGFEVLDWTRPYNG